MKEEWIPLLKNDLREVYSLQCHCGAVKDIGFAFFYGGASMEDTACHFCLCLYKVSLTRGAKKVHDCMDNASTNGPTAKELEKEIIDFADASKKWRDSVRGFRAEHDRDFYVKPYRPVEAVTGKAGDAIVPMENVPSFTSLASMDIPTAHQMKIDAARRLAASLGRPTATECANALTQAGEDAMDRASAALSPDLGRKVRERMDEFLSKPKRCLCFASPVDYCEIPLHAENARNARKR